MGACDQCYRAKLRCSGVRPVCDRCSQRRYLCTYTSNRPIGRPKRDRRTLSDSGYDALGVQDGILDNINSCLSNQHRQPISEPIATGFSAASARSLEPPNSTQWKEFDGEHADHNFENNVQDTRIAEIDGTNAQDIDTDLDIFLHSLDSELGHSNHQLAQTGHAERPDNPELISDAYTSTYNLDGPDVFVALEKEGNAPISVASQCSRAAELITGLSCISNNNTGGTFQSSLQLAQESIDFVAQVIERVSIHDSGSRAALVITTLCHVIMRLALQTYRHLRLQIAEHKDSDTLGSAKVSEMLDTPLMLGMIQIRSAQARRQVFEALIEAESTRAEDVVDTMRERFRAKAEDDGTDVIISAVWTCLLDFGSTEAQKTSTLDPSTRRQRYDV